MKILAVISSSFVSIEEGQKVNRAFFVAHCESDHIQLTFLVRNF